MDLQGISINELGISGLGRTIICLIPRVLNDTLGGTWDNIFQRPHRFVSELLIFSCKVWNEKNKRIPTTFAEDTTLGNGAGG